MTKYTPMALLLFCAWSFSYASDKIPISAVPSRVRGAVQYYAPGAQLIDAKVSEDRIYRTVYDCTYLRNVHLGSIKLSSRGQLIDIDESLVIEDVPPAVQATIRKETRQGLIKVIKLDALYGRAVYRVKSYYGNSTNIEISLTITPSGRVVARKISRGLLIFGYNLPTFPRKAQLSGAPSPSWSSGAVAELAILEGASAGHRISR